MANDTLNNAHQQVSVPLLRRPRAPKPAKIASNKSTKTSDQCDYHLTSDETWIGAELGNLELEEAADGRSNFVIHSLYPRGPQLFPPGNVLHSYGSLGISDPPPVHHSLREVDLYELEAWMPPKPVLRTLRSGAMLSRQNYKKLTGWFATHVPKQETLNTVNFSLEAGSPPVRKPAPQAIIGM